MKIVTLYLLMLCPIVGLGQKITMQIDKLYGDTTYKTDEWALFEKKFMGERLRTLSITIYKDKAGYSFMLTGYQASNDVILIRKKEDLIHFKLADGTIVDCPSVTTDFSSNSIRHDYSIFVVGCSVPYIDIEKFIKNDVTLVRVEHSRGYYDFDVDKKFTRNISFLLRKMKEKYPNL